MYIASAGPVASADVHGIKAVGLLLLMHCLFFLFFFVYCYCCSHCLGNWVPYIVGSESD